MEKVLTQNQLRHANPKIQKRIEQLKSWRRDVARARKVSAYLVLTNRTLLAIARDRPRTKDDLLRIKGIGPRKLKSFGQAILRQLNS